MQRNLDLTLFIITICWSLVLYTCTCMYIIVSSYKSLVLKGKTKKMKSTKVQTLAASTTIDTVYSIMIMYYLK